MHTFKNYLEIVDTFVATSIHIVSEFQVELIALSKNLGLIENSYLVSGGKFGPI